LLRAQGIEVDGVLDRQRAVHGTRAQAFHDLRVAGEVEALEAGQGDVVAVARLVGDRAIRLYLVDGILRDQALRHVEDIGVLVVVGDFLGRARRVPDADVVHLPGEGRGVPGAAGTDKQLRIGARDRVVDISNGVAELLAVHVKGEGLGRGVPHGGDVVPFVRGKAGREGGDLVRPAAVFVLERNVAVGVKVQVIGRVVRGGFAVFQEREQLASAGQAAGFEPQLKRQVAGDGEGVAVAAPGHNDVVHAIERQRVARLHRTQDHRGVVHGIHGDADRFRHRRGAVEHVDGERVGAEVIGCRRVFEGAVRIDEHRAVHRLAAGRGGEGQRVAVHVMGDDAAGQHAVLDGRQRVGVDQRRRGGRSGLLEGAVVAMGDIGDGRAVGGVQRPGGDQRRIGRVQRTGHVRLNLPDGSRHVVDPGVEHLAVEREPADAFGGTQDQAADLAARGIIDVGNGGANLLPVDVDGHGLCRCVPHQRDMSPLVRGDAGGREIVDLVILPIRVFVRILDAAAGQDAKVVEIVLRLGFRA